MTDAPLPLQVPIQGGQAEWVVKKSRFLSTVSPLQDVTTVKAVVQACRKQHPQARHVVWAFVVGAAQEKLGCSDDGEPYGTAGRPTLTFLQREGLTNILVTTVRYFGGIKLGTGGLVKAYTAAARLAVDAVVLEPLMSKLCFRLVCAYDAHPVLQYALTEAEVEVLETHYDENVTMLVQVVETAYPALAQHLTDVVHGQLTLTRIEAPGL